MLDGIKSFRPVAWLIANWQLALAIAGAIALTNSVTYCKGVQDGKAIEKARHQEALLDSVETGQKSENIAIAEGEIEQGRIVQDKEDADAAIRSTGQNDRKPSLASNALNCERLRRAGEDLRGFPACGPRESRTGASAGD